MNGWGRNFRYGRGYLSNTYYTFPEGAKLVRTEPCLRLQLWRRQLRDSAFMDC